LVQWALHHGYDPTSVSLTITWTRAEIQERLGCWINDDFIKAAQEWLDRTSGGFAAAVAHHLWEDILAQMETEFFTNYVQSAVHRWDCPVDTNGDPCRFINFYNCDRCGHEWKCQWTGTCNDDCPSCGDGEYEPTTSIEIDVTAREAGLVSDCRTCVKITEDDWEERFEPGDLLGLEDAEIDNIDERLIWTQVDDFEGDGFLIYPGKHWVNRVGYFLCRRPWHDPQLVVKIPLGDNA
jgi:hypothetical protein